MYPISSAVKELFDRNQKQVIRIRMDTESETYNLTEADIISGSFSIDRYSITGTRIEVGTACAGECKFKLKNYNGQWNAVKFEGAQLFIEIGIADWANYQSASDITWIPCGYFTVDAPVKTRSILSVDALDRMAKLDKPADWSQLTSATTVQMLVSRICDLCDVVLANGSAVASLPNASYQIVLPTDADLTYRNLLQAACMLMGTCAFFNYNGLLEIKWYTNTSVSIDETKRYSHEIQENDITITGVYFYRENSETDIEEYLSGTKDYAIDISDNPLLGNNVEGVVTALGTALNGFTYRPAKATVKPAPYLYPMDEYSFLKAGNTYTAIVSNVTVGLNANTSIEGKGETKENNGYATYGNFNNVQSKIVEYAKKKVDKEINDRTMLLMNLNEMVMNSLGLYETTLAVSGGGYQYYFHDASTLANSTIIYTFDANGFAWTDDWNDGDPIWNYGITRDGNAIINMLSAYKISADIITAGTMRAVNLIFGTEPNTTELRTNDTLDGALFEGEGVMQFETNGEFRAINFDSQDRRANRLQLSSEITDTTLSATYNAATFSNYYQGDEKNWHQMRAYSDRTYHSIVNNRVSAQKNANSFHLEAYPSYYRARIQNAQFNYLDSSNNSVTANSLSLYSDANGNSETLSNYKKHSSNLANSVSLSNASSYNYLTLSNYDCVNNRVGNRLYFANETGVRRIDLNNYDTNGNYMNWVGLIHFPQTTENSIQILNRWVNTQYANWIQLQNSGTTSKIEIHNYTQSGTTNGLANYMIMQTGSSQNYIDIINYQYGAANVINSRIKLNGDIYFECQNRVTFDYNGNGKQFFVTGANNGIAICAEVKADTVLAPGTIYLYAPNGVYANGTRIG